MKLPHSEAPFRCVLLGGESLLIQCGEILLSHGHRVEAVGSRDPRIQEWCEAKGIPVVPPGTELAASLAAYEFDYLFSITHLTVVPEEVLALPRRAAINFHDGPLPRYAGMYTPAWALLQGESEYGVSFHEMSAAVDEGAIYLQRSFAIEPDETSLTLNARCYEAAIEGFESLCTELATGTAAPQPQQREGGSYFGRGDRPTGLGVLDWSLPATELERTVRALDFGPYENAFCAAKVLHRGRVRLVGRAAVRPGQGSPGTILEVTHDEIVVATGDGALAIGGLRTVAGEAATVADTLSAFSVSLGSDLERLSPERTRDLDSRGAQSAGAEGFWRKRLQGLAPIGFPLPPFGEPVSRVEPRYESLDLEIPREFVEGVGRTGGAALVASFASHLFRLSGRSRFDLAFSDDSLAAAELEFGELFARWVPLRVEVSSGDSGREALAGIEASIARLEERGGYLRDVVGRSPDLASRPDTGRPAFASVGAALVADPAGFKCAPGAEAVLVVARDGLRARLVYEASRVSREAAETLCRHLTTFLIQLGSDAEQDLGRIPLLAASERTRVVEQWNASETDFDRSLCVHELIEEQASRTPDAVALRCEGESLTYAELMQRSAQLASYLLEQGVGPDRLVGIHLDRSLDMAVSVVAVLRSGGAYVPLDPSYPAERLAHMVEDSKLRVIVSHDTESVREIAGDATVVSLTRDGARIAQCSYELPARDVAAPNLGYVIYTSGSTGSPKGVMVEHRNITNFFAGMDDRIPHDAPGVWLAVTSLSFDISVLELLWTLARGFEVVIHRDRTGRSGATRAPAPWRPIDFGLAMWGADEPTRAYELMLETARFGDERGFSSFHTPERHFGAFGGAYPNPAVTSAAVAAVTSRIKIRSGSCVVPLHHPLRVAEEWAVVDNLSSGRAEIAFASGWQPNDFVLRPENHADAKAKMFEGADVVRRLWRGEAVEFENPMGDLVPTRTQPRPVQNELEAWITTAGNTETFEMAGAAGYHVLTHLLGQSLEETAAKIAAYRRAREAAGFDPATGRVTLMLHTYVGDDNDRVRELVRQPMKDYLGSAVALVMGFAWTFPAFARPGGPDSKPEDVDLASLSEEEVDTILEFAFERYYETSGLFGTPELCAEMVDRVRGAGVDEICALVDFGLSKEDVLAGLKGLDTVREQASVRPHTEAHVQGERDDFSLAALIERHRVTHMQCTPSMAGLLATDPDTRGSLATIDHLLIGGEAFPVTLASDLASLGCSDLTNLYGPTETTIWSSSAVVDPSLDSISIGSPIANTQLYIVDSREQLLPVGVPGELVIGGEGVTRGYLGRPDLTDDRFIADPFAGTPGARLYRTGDLARWTPDGSIEFLGRMDQQVKVRGHRIELGEIETRLGEQAGVRQCVVVAHEGNAGPELIAYWVCGAAAPSVDDLREALRKTLPDFMLPSRFIALEQMPRTPNGKLDRKALPAPDEVVSRVQAPHVAPEGEVEEMLAQIWREVLCLERVGMDDNFFDLGGHSLLVVQAHRKLRDAWPQPVSLTDLYRCPTVRSLAQLLHSGGGSDEQAERGRSRAEKRKAMSRRRGRGRKRGD